jgi:hypothetical protein
VEVVWVDDVPSSRLLLDVEDPLGRRIQLFSSQWFGHILQRHPDMATLASDVWLTVRPPDFICDDAVEEARICHYRLLSG